MGVNEFMVCLCMTCSKVLQTIDVRETGQQLVGSVWSPILKRGLMFPQSQSTSRMLQMSDWVKMDCRTGARAGAQDFKIMAGIWSSPVTLFGPSVVNSFRVLLVEMSSGRIGGCGLSSMSGVLSSSCVKMDWK